jgi:diguanylate cyclase (GGDEF)-like protein/PAS domain S-box-containing protein
VILALGIAVVVRQRASLVSLLFSSVTLLSALWLAGFAQMYDSETADQALFWARLASFFAFLIPPAVFHFSTVYAGRGMSLRPAVVVAWFFCAAIAITGATSSMFTRGVKRFDWGWYPVGYRSNIAWVAVFGVLFVIALRLMSAAAASQVAESHERAQALVRAFAVGSLAFIDFFPTIGFPVYPLGFIAMLAFAGVAADAIWRFQLVELTPEYAAGQILATMKNAVIVVDLRSVMRVVNRAALRMLGYEDAAEVVGKHIKTVIDPTDDMSSDRLMQSSGTLDMQMKWREKSGTTIDVIVASSFVRAADGAPVGVVYAATDITERRRAEQALRESEHRYRTLFEGNPLPMWIYDYESLGFIAVNDAAVRHYGYTKDEFLGMTIEDIRPPEDLPQLQAALTTLREQNLRGQYRHIKKDGGIIDVEVSSYEFVSVGRRARLVIAADVTDRRKAEERLRESEERYRLLFERNLAGVFRSRVDGHILDVNDALARMFGYEREEILRTNAGDLYWDSNERLQMLLRLRQQKTLSNLELQMKKKDGTSIWVLENMTLLEGPDGGVIEGTIVDISDRKEAQDQIEFQAYHDTLTGLPNRLLFRDRIGVALAHARRTRRTAAVMFLDLDQFKLVNDTLGHTVGDGLLQAAAERLVRCVRAEDTVARMGGDEFTVLLADISDSRGVSTVAQKVLETMAAPIVVDHHELFITTSIGIALFPDDGDDAEALLKSADRAMYRAKEVGRNNFQFATHASEEIGVERLSIERSMHYASRRDEFVVYYQPMVQISTQQVVGAEALIRWKHPVRGLMRPDEFIPIAEQTGLIIPVGEWVLRSACDQMKQWHSGGNDALRVAVNLSARQFQQPDLSQVIERVLVDTGLPATSLDIEITESTAMQNADLTLATLNKLKAMGVRISIDDFGTGYSSLSYLKRFPIDTVKIDKEFVRDLASDTNDAAIVSAIISMASALRLRVVAEGVETEDQMEFLRKKGCEFVQGYLCGKPVDSAVFEQSFLKFEVRSSKE